MLIALDYDKTFTADPNFWREVIAAGRRHGHEFVCVTGRREPPGAHEPPIGLTVVCAGSDYKRHAAANAGYAPDVWIDDMPEMIAPTRILDWSR